MTTDFVSEWKDAVQRTASFVCRDFPDVDREDVHQQLYLFLWEKRDVLRSPDQIGSTKALMRAATQYAWSQRKEHLQLSAQYSYRTSDVKQILQTVFDRQDWESVKVAEDMRSEYNDVFLEINTDIKRAWEQLGHAQKRLIFKKYALGEEPTTEADKKRLYRAIYLLTDKLNWYQRPKGSQYVGTRKAITNANARANISHLED